MVYPGMKQVSIQKYNFDGKDIVTLSPGGTNMYYEQIKPGTEEKFSATIEGDKLIVNQSGAPIEFTKATKEEYEKFEAEALAGTYEYKEDPTIDYSQYEELATELSTEETTDSATEAVTEEITE